MPRATAAVDRRSNDPQAIPHEMRAINEIVSRLKRPPKPTLAVVDGTAMGVALGLIPACDLILAGDGVRFAEVRPEAKPSRR